MATQGNDLTLRVGFDVNKFAADMSKAQGALSSFTGKVETGMKGLIAAFSVKAIGSFVMDISKLAGQAEGVSAAFNRLENASILMRDLKDATGGTVAELELMKRAVMASNFDISLKSLPQLLEFATIRARQTGQSVDYLVDSIVTGIGRKSKLILDNLGISAVQLTEALGGASAASSTIGEVATAVGKIAEENLKKMGKLTDDAAVKADRLSASWENFKVSIGTLANNAGVSRMIELANELANLMNLAAGGKSNSPMKDLEVALKLLNTGSVQRNTELFNRFLKQAQVLAEQAGVELRKITDESGKMAFHFRKKLNFINATEVKEQARTIGFLREQIKLIEEDINNSTTDPILIQKWKREIIALEREIKKLDGTWEESPIMNGEMTMPKIDDFIQISDFAETVRIELDGLDDEIQESMEWFDKWYQNYVDKKERIAQTSARIGDAIGSSFGDIITGAQTFGQAMASAVGEAINALEKYVLAMMIARSAKFGPVGILLAAAGFGIVKSIFRNLSKGGGSSGPNVNTSDFRNTGGMNAMAGGMQLVAQVTGKQLQFVLKEQQTFDSRVKTT